MQIFVLLLIDSALHILHVDLGIHMVAPPLKGAWNMG